MLYSGIDSNLMTVQPLGYAVLTFKRESKKADPSKPEVYTSLPIDTDPPSGPPGGGAAGGGSGVGGPVGQGGYGKSVGGVAGRQGAFNLYGGQLPINYLKAGWNTLFLSGPAHSEL